MNKSSTTSIGTMIEQLDGLRDTKDLTHWEHGFITGVLERYLLAGKDTTRLSPKQVEAIEKIWSKHFA
jgi:hypothetical protein